MPRRVQVAGVLLLAAIVLPAATWMWFFWSPTPPPPTPSRLGMDAVEIVTPHTSSALRL